MTLNEASQIIEHRRSENLSDRQYHVAMWKMLRAFPHANAHDVFMRCSEPDSKKFAAFLLQFEAEHAHEPLPPPISREMLINNIEYIQHMRNTLGSECLEVVIPLSLDFPAADLETMLKTTHKDATPKVIADEMLRRQAADAAGHGPGEAARPGKHGST